MTSRATIPTLMAPPDLAHRGNAAHVVHRTTRTVVATRRVHRRAFPSEENSQQYAKNVLGCKEVSFGLQRDATAGHPMMSKRVIQRGGTATRVPERTRDGSSVFQMTEIELVLEAVRVDGLCCLLHPDRER